MTFIAGIDRQKRNEIMQTLTPPAPALSPAPATDKYLHPRDCRWDADPEFAARQANILKLMRQREAITKQIEEAKRSDPAVKNAIQQRLAGIPTKLPTNRARIAPGSNLLTVPPAIKDGDQLGIDYDALERQDKQLWNVIQQENMLNHPEGRLCKDIQARLSAAVQPYFRDHHFRDMTAINADLIQRVEAAMRDEDSFHAGQIDMPAGNCSAMKSALPALKLLQDQLVNFLHATGDNSFDRLPAGYARWQDRPLGAHIPAPV